MSSYIPWKSLSFLTRVAQNVFNTSGSYSLVELSILWTFNIQNWFICSSIRNWIAYANEANIVNKDSPIHDVSSFSPWVFNLFVSNSRERVYFEHQIPTPNMSRIKCTHISRQVKGLCISWISLQGYRMKPSMSRRNQPWIRIKKTTGANNNLHYNLRLPWNKSINF